MQQIPGHSSMNRYRNCVFEHYFENSKFLVRMRVTSQSSVLELSYSHIDCDYEQSQRSEDPNTTDNELYHRLYKYQ